MAKGYAIPVNEALAKFSERVRLPDIKDKYERRTAEGFSRGWSLWYDYMMAKLIENAGEWIDKEGIDKWKAVKEIVKEASQEYRKAKLGIFAKEYHTELEQAKALVEEALALIEAKKGYGGIVI